MAFIQHNGIRYFQFDTLQTRHALFTRHGGVSPDPWGSLNVGGTVGDDLTARPRKPPSFLSGTGLSRPKSIFDVWQVHSADVVCARAPRPADESYRQADIILTDQPECDSLYALCRLCTDPAARPTQGSYRDCTCRLDGHSARCGQSHCRGDEEELWLEPGGYYCRYRSLHRSRSLRDRCGCHFAGHAKVWG